MIDFFNERGSGLQSCPRDPSVLGPGCPHAKIFTSEDPKKSLWLLFRKSSRLLSLHYLTLLSNYGPHLSRFAMIIFCTTAPRHECGPHSFFTRTDVHRSQRMSCQNVLESYTKDHKLRSLIGGIEGVNVASGVSHILPWY